MLVSLTPNLRAKARFWRPQSGYALILKGVLCLNRPEERLVHIGQLQVISYSRRWQGWVLQIR